MAEVTFSVLIHEEDGSFWAEVEELPGCFASGFTLPELQEALWEAMQMYLPDGIKLGEPRWGELQAVGGRAARHAGGKSKKLLVCA